MTKEELEKEAREYLAEHSKYSEVFGEFFVAVDTLTAMLDFIEPREKRIEELEKEIERITVAYNNCVRDNYYKTSELEAGIALKDEEMGCIETDFNTFKSKAKELLKKWIEPKYDREELLCLTEQFLSEVEK